MFVKLRSLALTATCAVAALLFAAMPVDARGGGGGGRGGGGRGGGGWGGGRGGDWGGGRGGYGGYGGYGGWGGYRGGYGGWGGYYGGYYGGYPYSGYSDYYAQPYYGASDYNTQPYYSAPATTITVTPSYDANVSTYAEPAAPDNRSRVEVKVPNDSAQVLFDGAPTQQTGTDRVFATPPLDPGKTYHYTVEAKWMDNGKAMDQTRTINVAPNQTAVVDFGNNDNR